MAQYDSSNPKHIAIARKADKAADDARRGFIAHIMGMVDGRAYLHSLLTDCHVFHQPFSPNPHITAFACGELNIGQRILADIMAFCPDDYTKMMREANARDATISTRLERSDADSRGDDNRSGAAVYQHPAFDTPAGADRTAAAVADARDYDPVERDEADSQD